MFITVKKKCNTKFALNIKTNIYITINKNNVSYDNYTKVRNGKMKYNHVYELWISLIKILKRSIELCQDSCPPAHRANLRTRQTALPVVRDGALVVAPRRKSLWHLSAC